MTPLIIIGAGRSGTNLLRDCLTAMPGWATWDCDEINLIWRHGNATMPHDVFGVDQARPAVSSYIQRQFHKLARQAKADIVIEKTCANSLRVPFINAIFPEARYIYIRRDGRDVALSAAKRWQASVELPYLLKKLRFVPPTDVPRYGLRFIANRVRQARASDKRQAVWGPIFPGMQELAKSAPLIEVCAQQWAACVEASDAAFANLPVEKTHALRYEDLVADPKAVLGDLVRWIDPAKSPQTVLDAASMIRQPRNGWAATPDAFTQEAMAVMAPVLERHGYAAST